MDQLIEQDAEILYRAAGFFPVDLFPCEVVVYPNKIEVVDTLFFFSKDIKTILISDILEVQIKTSPFFSTVTIVSRQPMLPEVDIKWLLNRQAIKLRNIIQGLVIASQSQTDVTGMDSQTLKTQTQQLGSTAARMT